MENLYKYFFWNYKKFKNIAQRCFIQMCLVGFNVLFYLSQKPFFQSIYKFLFVKRPRESNDILTEPETQQWLCETQIIPMTISTEKSVCCSSFKKKSASIPVYSFHMKEKYMSTPITYSENEKSEEKDGKDGKYGKDGKDGKVLLTHSVPTTSGKKQKCFQMTSSPFSYSVMDKYGKGNFLLTYSIPVNTDNGEKYLRIILNNPFPSFSIKQPPKLSNVSFLDIQYHHPKMNSPLPLEVPKEWCCIGNELFSAAFVLRMLYYQELPFVFDMNYTLNIMDSDLNAITLNSSQHIMLKNTDYNILGN